MNIETRNKIMNVIGILKTVNNEVLSVIAIFLIIESAVMIPYIQDIETKQCVYNTSFYEQIFVSLNTQHLFLNLGTIAIVLCIVKNIIYLIPHFQWNNERKNLFIRIVVNFISYGIILFFGRNHSKPYGSLDITRLICVYFVCFILDKFLNINPMKHNVIDAKEEKEA